MRGSYVPACTIPDLPNPDLPCKVGVFLPDVRWVPNVGSWSKHSSIAWLSWSWGGDGWCSSFLGELFGGSVGG